MSIIISIYRIFRIVLIRLVYHIIWADTFVKLYIVPLFLLVLLRIVSEFCLIFLTILGFFVINWLFIWVLLSLISFYLLIIFIILLLRLTRLIFKWIFVLNLRLLKVLNILNFLIKFWTFFGTKIIKLYFLFLFGSTIKCIYIVIFHLIFFLGRIIFSWTPFLESLFYCLSYFTVL